MPSRSKDTGKLSISNSIMSASFRESDVVSRMKSPPRMKSRTEKESIEVDWCREWMFLESEVRFRRAETKSTEPLRTVKICALKICKSRRRDSSRTVDGYLLEGRFREHLYLYCSHKGWSEFEIYCDKRSLKYWLSLFVAPLFPQNWSELLFD